MSWYTKKDVFDDLAQVMGGRLKDLDEQFILIGEQPPPPCRSGEEDDEELLLRLYGGVGDKVADEVDKGPDLAGITEMLRMVDKHECSDSDEINKHSLQDNGTTIISISKLNPDVPAFVPTNGISTENKKDGKTKESDAVNNSNEELGILDSAEKLSERMDPVMLKEISEKLKSKISSPSKLDCFKKKRERNIAIVSLLKLYSETPTTITTDKSTPKLMKPDYFEKAYIKEPLCDKAPNNSQQKSISRTSSYTNKNTVNSVVDIKVDNNSINQEVAESVAKVNNWLNKEEKPTPNEPALFLGPVTFKKKEKAKPSSPRKTTPTSDMSDKSQSKTVSSHFVPSAYASKLTQSYMERSKAKENQTKEETPVPLKKQTTLWSTIEKQLKAKDEEMSRRKREETVQRSGEGNENADECS